jgi:hypothetical protein
VSENAANNTLATATAWMEWGYAFLKLGTSAPYDGCQYNTLKNCTITLNRNNASATLLLGSIGVVVANFNNASTSFLTISTLDETNSYNKFYGNTITNSCHGMYFYGMAASTPFSTYDQSNDIGGTSLATGNTMNNIAGTVNTSYGIYAMYQNNMNVGYNTYDNAANGGVGALTTIAAMFLSGTSTPNSNANYTITNNSIKLTNAATSAGSFYGVYAAGGGNVLVNANTFSAASTGAGTNSFIMCISATANHNSYVASNNIFTNINVNTSGTLSLIYSSSPAQFVTISNNVTVGTVTRSTTGGATYLLYSAGSPTAGVHNVYGNNFSNFSNLISGTTYGCYYLSGSSIGVGPDLNIYNNTFSNYTTNGITFGIGIGYGKNNAVYNNLISNYTATGSTIGLNIGTNVTNQLVYGNNINNLTSSGTSAISGINMASSAASIVAISKNKIYGLRSNTTTTGTVNGILLGSGNALTNVFNNVIGDLTAPTGVSTTDQVRGISITSTTLNSVFNIYYNSIYLSGSSSGATFGASGIFHTASATATTATLNLINNIIINNCVAKGTGKVAAIRRSAAATLANYGATSNRNLLYAGTPSASNNIMFDGTNSYQTLANYQTVISPRDANSVTESATPFLSTVGSNANFLRIDSSQTTLASNGGVAISNYNDDYFGNIRQGSTGYAGTGSAPDIGANEFNPFVACTTPAPGNTLASVATTCPSSPVVLSLQNASTGSVVSYQWYTGPTSTGPWTAFGTNAPAQTIFPTSTAWYYCNVTCSVGPSVTASNPTQVNVVLTNACYCIATATSGCNAASVSITNVNFASINNATACTSLNYNNYSSSISTNVGQGQNIAITVSANAQYGGATDICTVWFDWNQNGIFGDNSNEKYTLSGNGTYTGSIAIPLTANLGNTFMRIRLSAVSGVNYSTPCGTATYGEVEDYAVTVVAPFTDASVSTIYSLGAIPKNYGGAHAVKVRINNTGSYTLNNLPVSLSVSGANTFSDVKTINNIAPGGFALVTFNAFTPANVGANSIVVSVPADGNNANNSNTWSQNVTNNIFSYKDPSQTFTGNVSPSLTATGAILAKFTTANMYGNADTLNEIQVDFNTSGVSYKIGIFDATGPGGAPGNDLYPTSPTLTTNVGTAYVPVPNILVSGTYYVGVIQTTTTAVGFRYQSESPIRTNSFYFVSPYTTPITWTDFGAGNNPYRFNVAAQIFIPVPPNCIIPQSPTSGSVACNSGTTLTWASGGGAPTFYDVYLSTNMNDVLNLDSTTARVSTRQTSLSYLTPALVNGQTYYWNIVAHNAYGNTRSANCGMQSFTASIVGCYCGGVSPSSGGSGYCITNVTLGNINNTTANCQLSGANNYSYQNATTNLVRGASHNISVSTALGSIVSVWIDYDHSNSFDPSEWTQVYTTGSAGNVNINIPSSAILGQTAMRIRSHASGQTNGAANACTSMFWGETEDYVVTIVAPVINDNPSGAIVLTPSTACVNYTAATSNASPTVGITATCTGTPDDDVWFKFKPGTNKAAFVTVTPDANMDAVMQLFKGPNSAAFTPLGCINNGANGVAETFLASNLQNLGANDSVWVRVFHAGNGYASGNFDICVISDAPPANDSCASATTLTITPTCVPVAGTSAWASSNAISSCANNDDDVWYTFSRPAGMTNVTVKVVGSSNYDVAFEILTGACGGTQTVLACVNNTTSIANSTEQYQILVPSGSAAATYYVRVYDARTGFGSGDFDICVYGIVPPPLNNDPCGAGNFSSNVANWGGANTILASYDGGAPIFMGQANNSTANPPTGVNLVYFTGSTAFANNLGANEPTPPCGNLGSNAKTVWFKFKAPTIGGVDVTLRSLFNGNPTNFSTIIAAYVASVDPCTGTPTYTNIGCATTGVLNLTAASTILAPYAGQYIYVQLAGNGASSPIGSYMLSIQAVPQNIALSNPTTSSLTVTLPTAPGATNVSVQWRTVGSAGYSLANVSPTLGTYTISGLNSGVNYQVWAKYYNNSQAFYTNFATLGTTIGCSASPAAPNVVPVPNRCSRDTITWFGHPLASGAFPYRLYWKQAASTGGYSVLAVPASAYNNATGKVNVLLTNLAVNTSYQFYYRVLCAGGAQVASNVATYTQCNGPAKLDGTFHGSFEHNGRYFVDADFIDVTNFTDNTPADGDVHEVVLNEVNDMNAVLNGAGVKVASNGEENGAFELIPNPTSDNVFVEYNLANAGRVVVRVMNIQGKVVKEEVMENSDASGAVQIDLSDVQSGVYMVSVDAPGYKATKRLVVTK